MNLAWVSTPIEDDVEAHEAVFKDLEIVDMESTCASAGVDLGPNGSDAPLR